MNVISIGELSRRFALQAPAFIADGGGGATASWALVAEIWGALRPLQASEKYEAAGLKGRVTHELWIRHRPGVTPEMRFVLGDRIFAIKGLIDPGDRMRFLRCLVEERVP